MKFLTTDDFSAVCDNKTLGVINQQDVRNLDKAEQSAIADITSALCGKYDMEQAFATTGDDRDAKLVEIACDLVLYRLIASLPNRAGFETREQRYKEAQTWLDKVQNGKRTANLPPLMNTEGEDIGNPIRYGGWDKSKYDY